MHIGKDPKEFQPLKNEYVQSPRGFMPSEAKQNFNSNALPNRENR
jgi:hypothetical protein